MDFDKICYFAEKLQTQLAGPPKWSKAKQVFEYEEINIKVVVSLKIIRAVQGLKSIEILCNNGLFIDMQALWRCVHDCVAEVFFLIEKYPEQDPSVEKFINYFSSFTIDNDSDLNPVESKKIQAAMSRVINEKNPSGTRDMIRKIYETYSGYIHANYVHIMEMYSGESENNLSFNLSGIPSLNKKKERFSLLEELSKSVVHAMYFIAFKFELEDLRKEIFEYYKSL
ncbi:MAG: DUF5677 domain-containing protein [Alphaproteobacteria bacterium]|nr:DUF5677 domain-containing protein [Alphaproteobacteria bacterium]